MASRTDTERYEQALAHIKLRNVGLEADVKQKITAQGRKPEDIGAELSLGGSGYWRSGSAEQHTAVRALLLCQVAYFRVPHCWCDYATSEFLKTSRAKFHGKSLAQVNTEIDYFVPGDNLTLDAVAAAAERVCELTGNLNELWRTADDTNLSTMNICYTGVAVWLFASRFVSRRWFIKKLDANTANDLIGKGVEVPPSQLDDIPKGYIWNIHKTGDPTTCHWGVSLGGGSAAACNNTGKSPSKELIYLKDDGVSQYGTFVFRDICDVLNGHEKYGHAGPAPAAGTYNNLKVFKINPVGNVRLF